MDKRLFIRSGLAAASGAFLGQGIAWAQAGFPNKPVRLVVPYTPGQSADIFGRMVALELAKGCRRRQHPRHVGRPQCSA